MGLRNVRQYSCVDKRSWECGDCTSAHCGAPRSTAQAGGVMLTGALHLIVIVKYVVYEADEIRAAGGKSSASCAPISNGLPA